VLSIDLHTLNEADLPREVTFTRRVVNAGRMDGYAVFFRARVDDDLSLCTSPLDPRRAPHWGFRILRTRRDDFGVGDEIEVHLTVGRWSDRDTWTWSHVKRVSAGHGLTPAGAGHRGEGKVIRFPPARRSLRRAQRDSVFGSTRSRQWEAPRCGVRAARTRRSTKWNHCSIEETAV